MAFSRKTATLPALLGKNNMLKEKEFTQRISPYIPEGCAPIIADYLKDKPVMLRISRKRVTKLGDYRHPYKDEYHRISVNHDLNQYAFLVTLVHEIAHLENWLDHKNKIKPHGKEWKREFQRLMEPFFEMDIFPDDIRKSLFDHLKNPGASSCSDPQLLKTLKKYDPHKVTHLDDLPHGAVFSLNGNRFFKKGDKLRTRYRCIDLVNKKKYLINGLAEVELVNEELF